MPRTLHSPGCAFAAGYRTAVLAAGLLLVALVARAQPESLAPTDDAGAALAGDAWHVVIMRNWDALYPINVEREQALRDAIVKDAPKRVEFFPEQVDPLRFSNDLEPQQVALLRTKYRGVHVDAVVASGLEPLAFATAHRDEIWPGTPIVYNGVIDGALEGWKRAPRTTGVSMIFDVAGTLALARALLPRARAVYVVSGASYFDRHLLGLVQRQMERADAGLEVKSLVALALPDVLKRVGELDDGAFVLYLTQLRDGLGRLSGPEQPRVRAVSAASRVPVFTPIHTQFGRGPVGGSSAPAALHGRIAGQLVRRVLEGADPDEIPLSAQPSPVCEVDWNALKRWGLRERDVPSHCTVAGRPPDPLRSYFWSVAALAIVVLVQGVLIWSLALQSRQRRRAEAQLRLRGMEMAQVARLSMVGELTASIAHEINQPMGAILSNAEAAQMMLDQGTLTPEKLREILADIRSEDLRASEVIRSLRKMLARSEWNLVALEPNTEVAEALRHVAFEAARRSVRLTPLFAPDVPAIFADSVQLQQVVVNLVMNAMDAVAREPDGAREVRIVTRPRDGGVEICVADTGPGVAAENRERLFQTTFTTKADGMGFGLSIVRTIIEMHRGTVSYEPNVPRGAVFRAWLPSIGT